ncbi:uncharacterized protein LOC144118898 [Amblyomma americanum]
MAPTQYFLPVLTLTMVFSFIQASIATRQYCYRLTPLSITSAITPCTFPCLLLSSNPQPRIFIHIETDGTPCRVGGGSHIGFLVSQCRRGVCQRPHSLGDLKRSKRACPLVQLLKKIIAGFKERHDLGGGSNSKAAYAYGSGTGRTFAER